MRPASLTAVLFLAIVALAHLIRLLGRVEVVIGGQAVPLWMSGAAFLFCGLLALALAREGRARP
ncbi:MAG TPA: hypothetical protein VF768_01945 [Holophagaceae bacterium]